MRPIRTMVDAALSEPDADFNAIYSNYYGRDSILPEKLLRAQLLMAFYTLQVEAVIPIPTFTERIAVGIHTNPRLTRMPCCSERARAQQRSWPVWGIC